MSLLILIMSFKLPKSSIGNHTLHVIGISNDKKIQFNKMFDVLYSRENSPWIVRHNVLQAVEYCSLGILENSEFMEH